MTGEHPDVTDVLDRGGHAVRITRARTGMSGGIAHVEVWLETADGATIRHRVVITEKRIGTRTRAS